MTAVGETLALQIEKPAAGGRMIARANGQIVLVRGVIPGERALVRIERVGKGVAYGEAVTIEGASPDRRPAAFDLSCGGCLFAHIAYPRQLTIKSEIIADALARMGKLVWPVPVAVAASPEAGYRMRARLHRRGNRVGFFREGSHALCDARPTAQLSDGAHQAIERFLSAAGADLPDLELDVSENVDGSERAIHLEPIAAEKPMPLEPMTPIEGLTGISLSDRGAIVVLEGTPYVHDTIAGAPDLRLRRHVLSFFQGNRYLLPALVDRVAREVIGGGTVVDLFAGVGLFSVAAAARGARVVAVEGDRISAADLDANVQPFAGAIEAVHQSVESFASRSRVMPDTLIVDPPRTGMSKEAVAGVIGLRARTIVYVSCDVATFGRDTRRLLDAGYTLETVDGFDLFPNTPHVETVAVFRR